jgi:hypothetical protein
MKQIKKRKADASVDGIVTRPINEARQYEVLCRAASASPEYVAAVGRKTLCQKYLRALDGHDWQDACRIILGMTPVHDCEDARRLASSAKLSVG